MQGSHNLTTTPAWTCPSIIQGSAIGPASYVVNAADLHTTFSGNSILKYADDTYLIIPASNIQSRAAELQNFEQWALTNNLKLNCTKTNEIIIVASGRQKSLKSPPPCLPGIEGLTSLKILGVTVSNKLSVSEHVRQIVTRCAQSFNALRILRNYGTEVNTLQQDFKSVLLGRAGLMLWGALGQKYFVKPHYS